MVRHEFSHPFINPLTEKNWDYIKDYFSNYDPIPEVAKKQVCGDWQECINEFVIRSITTQLAYNDGEEFGLKSYTTEKSRGVIYIDSLLNKIINYQLKRDKFYKTLCFSQQISRFKEDTVYSTEVIHEAYKSPGNLILKFRSWDSGDGLVFANDSLYTINDGIVDKIEYHFHDILVLGIDLYNIDPESFVSAKW